MDNSQASVPQTPVPAPAQPQGSQPPAAPHGGAGPMIGVGIVVLLLLTGGVYMYMTQHERATQALEQQRQDEMLAEQYEAERAAQAGTSDTEENIEADLSATGEADLDAELTELQNAL